VQPGGTVFEYDGGRSGGGDPSGSQEVSFEDYVQMTKTDLGKPGTAMMLKRRGQVVRVGSAEEANLLPKGVRYITPDGRVFER